MTERSSRLATQGFALAAVVATALGVSSYALAASPSHNANSLHIADYATKTIRAANVKVSSVVNLNDSDPVNPDVRHHWPDLTDRDPVNPDVRHHWPDLTDSDPVNPDVRHHWPDLDGVRHA